MFPCGHQFERNWTRARQRYETSGVSFCLPWGLVEKLKWLSLG
jgi:hypothetical protein